MASSSSQSNRSESEMVSELRPVMPFDLFIAAIEGDWDVLIPRLGLQLEEPTETMVAIEASIPTPEQIKTEHQIVQSELQSATDFGDTVLHLLVTQRHHELALEVFQRDRSLLNAHNKMSETPLHCAAKVGNREFIDDLIRIDSVIVKDAIKKIDENGDTPLHVAAKHGHVYVSCELMKCDSKVAHRANKDMLFPLHIAIMKNYTMLVKFMLEVDPTLACIPFSDGMFPAHVSARMGNIELLIHFITKYPNYAKLLDSRGRNLFHIAAEENQKNIFRDVFKDTNMGDMIVRMNNAWDNEGNTPLHIAAMKGHMSIMKAIWEKRMDIHTEGTNNEGLTPFELFARQLETNEHIDGNDIARYKSVEGDRFTEKWFYKVMKPAPTNKWEKTQVLGLGSVLITTVTFAAAFTIPGGYNQNNGTPVLGRRYVFRAFILANALAFIQGFLSLFALLFNSEVKKFGTRLSFAAVRFMMAASSMVVAFGLGMYVTLAPLWYPIAVLLLVVTIILGTPVGIISGADFGPKILRSIFSRLKSNEKKDFLYLDYMSCLSCSPSVWP